MLEEKEKQTEKETLRQGIRIIWIVWAGMVVSLALYLFVGHQVAGRLPGPRAADVVTTWKTALYAAAAVVLALIPRLRRYMLKTGAGTVRQLPARAGRPAFHPAVACYMNVTVVALALAECIGIFGMVLVFLGVEIGTLYLFVAVSAGALIYYRPRMEELERLAAAMKADPEALKTGP